MLLIRTHPNPFPSVGYSCKHLFKGTGEAGTTVYVHICFGTGEAWADIHISTEVQVRLETLYTHFYPGAGNVGTAVHICT